MSLNGRWYPVRLLAKRDNQNEDIAVIGVEYKGNLPCYPVHPDSEFCAGFAIDSFSERSPRFDPVIMVAGNESGGIWVDYKASPGQSGSPGIYGNLVVGIVKGYSDGNRSYLTGLKSIRSILLERFNKIPQCGPIKQIQPVAPAPPKDNPPSPIHNHDDLLAKIQSLELQLQRIREDFDALKLKQGPQGKPGVDGTDGKDGSAGRDGRNGFSRDGTVTIILVEDGEESNKVDNVRAGSTVRLNVNRKKKED